MKILEDINVNGSGNFDNELTATSLSSITSLFLQGFELKPYSLDGRTPDRLMYDGYVLLDEYNYGEYLDSAYVTLNSAQTISGTKTFSQDIVGNVNGSAQFIGNNPTKNTNKKSLQIYSGGMAYGDEIDEWNSPHGNNTDQTGLKIDYGTILRLRYSTNYYHDIWFDANKSSIVYRKITNNVSAGWVTILDNLNFSTHLDSAYIKKSGDTVTGQITSSVANGTAPFVVASNTEVANLHSATATKLHTARTIAISGAVTGTATAFDGSSNISINTTSVDASKLSGYAKMYYGHHPEDEGLLPFIYNDLAYLSEVGGACSIYTTTDTDYTKSDLTKESVIAGSYSVMFDCSPRYQGFSLDSTSTVLVIDIDCPTKFSYENKFYIDFGNNSWKANEIKVYVWNDAADNTSKAYKLKAESSSVPARFMASLIYSYSNGTSTVQGFNKLRVILTDFARTNPRIAQIGLINMNSLGARMGYVSRGIDDKLYRNFTPAKNSTYDLGSGNNRWLNIYGTNADFTGSVTTQSIIGVSSNALVISSTNDDLALRRNNTDATSVVLNNSAFKPYNAANGLLDLGASNARWKVIYGLSLDLSGHIYLPNSGMIYAKNASNSYIGLLQFNNINSLLIGQDVAKKGYNTNIYGNNIALCYGTAGSTSNIALYVNSDGNVGIGTIYPTYKLDVNGTFNVSGGATIGGSLTTGGNILPSTNNGANIGQSDRRWLNGYIDNLYSDVISADTLTSRTSPYLNVTAASLDLISCELYGYDSDGNANWNIASNGIASLNSVVISSNDYVHNINGNADGELVIWPSEYLVIENDTITDYAITCSKLVQTSDIRYKNILSNVHLKLSDIAAAPTFKFAWANETDGSTHIGTSAQYWQDIAGELVTENKKTGKLGLDYSTAALVSAISIARELESAKQEIQELKDKISALEGRIV